jgi:membrane-associated phospholipid phosphatase
MIERRGSLLRAVPGAVLILALWTPAAAFAQAAAPPPQPDPQDGQKVAEGEAQAKKTRRFFPALFSNLGEDLKHIPRRNSLYWLAAGSALALAVHPEDEDINRRLVGSSFADTVFKPGKYIGSLPVLLGTGVATWAVGRRHNQPRAQHVGMDLIESALLSEGIVEAIKFSVRRQRPVHEDGTQAPGYSFPSGHATMTFAAATVMQQHLGWKWAVPTYTIASYVAVSRLHDNRHWASDVAFGAATGIIIGRSVTWHGRNFYASPMLLPKGAGVMVNVRP